MTIDQPAIARPASPPPPPPGLRIAGPLLILFAAFVVGVIVFLVTDAAGASEDTANALSGTALSLAILVFGLMFRAQLPRHERAPILAPKRSIATCLAVGLGLAVVLRIGVGIISTIGEAVDPSLCKKYVEATDIVPPELWHRVLLAFSLVVLAPLGEELLFRGLLLRGLARRMPFGPAAVVSGVVFGAAHPQYWTAWPLVIGITAFGVVAAFVYRRMGYPATVAAHAVFNGVAAIFLFVDVDTDRTCEE